MTNRIRLFAGGTALIAGLWFLTTATAAPPALPKDSYKKAIESDVAAIQKLFKDGTPVKGSNRTIKATAMMLALYGQATGDNALTSQAVQVAEAMTKKDYAGAEKAAKGLSSPKGEGALKGPLEKQAKFDLEDSMSPFRLSRVGGLNIEADIKSQMKDVKDVKLIELIGVRTAAIAEFASHYSNDKADANAGSKAKWEKLMKEMSSLSKQLVEESGKGEKANAKTLANTLKRLDANCSNCHTDYRD